MNTGVADGAYKQNQIKMRQQQVANINVASRKKRISFGQSTWFGFMASTSPSQLPNGYGVEALNIYPNATYFEKSLGYTSVGTHVLGSFNANAWKGLATGEIAVQYTNNPEISKNLDVGIFKIVKSKTSDETIFYFLDNESVWQIRNPFSDYWKIDGTKNPTPNTVYNFKGEDFNYIVWKKVLYICSGKEEFRGSDGKLHGLMKWDGTEWNSIDCGFAGFPNNQLEYINKTAINLDGTFKNPNYRLTDSSTEFNPSLIILYNERLYISGDTFNPLQVKMSEWNNPDNFVENVLGFQTAPLTSKDSARASSFIITSGNDSITSLNLFNDNVYIGTTKGFFIYQLVQQNISGNTQFQLDAIVQNNYVLAGTPNQHASLSFQNKLYFLTDNNVIPEISNFELTFATVASTPKASYRKLSSSLDDFFRRVDITNSCIGIYGDRVLVGCKYGNSTEGNNITILMTPFALDANTTQWGFVILDYIKPNYFNTNNKGCYFTSAEDGLLYKILPTQFGVSSLETDEIGNALPVQYPSSVFQTGWTGYNPSSDSSISQKKLEKILLYGYFSEDTIIRLTFFIENGCDQDGEVCSQTKTIEYICKAKDKQETNCSLSKALNRNINYRYGAKHYELNWNFGLGADMVQYTKMSVRIDIENSRYFMLENFIGISTEVSADSNAVINPTFTQDFEIELSDC